MAITGNGSLATTLFLFLIPAALHKGWMFMNRLSKALWYMDPHLHKFKERGFAIPERFLQLPQGLGSYNRYEQTRHKAPKLDGDQLRDHCSQLSTSITQPWAHRNHFTELREDVVRLTEAMEAYTSYLEKVNQAMKHGFQQLTPVRTPEADVLCYTVKATYGPVSPQYSSLLQALEEMPQYHPLFILDFAPEDRFQRRKWMDNLKLPVTFTLYKFACGNYLGTLTFIWKVSSDSDGLHESRQASVLSTLSKDMPTYHTRAMQKAFLDKYACAANVNKFFLREMYRFLTDDMNAPKNAEQGLIDEKVALFLLDGDDPDLILDMRKLNGKPQSSFQPFWDEVQKYFDEYTAQVNDRRHGEYLYLPFAVSVEDLRETVEKRLPSGTEIPSAQWLRLQFTPKTPWSKSALQYTGRFDLKFMVQSRVIRKGHQDSKFVAVQWNYIKQFACMWQHDCQMLCVDDKAIIPVGEPGQPVGTCNRGRHPSIAPVSGPVLAAADHDYHISGLVPSVMLIPDIPASPSGSFYDGKVHVTVKDKVFQPSSPLRHTVENVNILRGTNYSEDGVSLNKSILIMQSDGGPDHRTTYASVQACHTLLFVELDLDMLIACRTAPGDSWANPAERVNSLLNLGLQGTALAREEMENSKEKRVKKCNTMKSLRETATKQPDLKEAFEQSIQPVAALVSDRFERLKWKGTHVKAHQPATQEEIANMAEQFNIIDPEVDMMKDLSRKGLDKDRFKQFQDRHFKMSQYMVQIKKCKENDPCWYCSINPPRLPAEQFKKLRFVPDPTLAENRQEYKKFDYLYSLETTDKDRPSLTANSETVKRSAVMVSGKVRETITCVECEKPRCIYAKSKLSREEQEAVQRVREENIFTCGSVLFQEDSPYHEQIVVFHGVTCGMQMESQYYAEVTVSFPDVCVHCGSPDILEGEEVVRLKQQFRQVRPMCTVCKQEGKQFITRAPTNLKKRS